MNWKWLILVCVTPVFSQYYHELSEKIIHLNLKSTASFGFSLSSFSSGPTSKLLVGAPLADEAGEVYCCDPTTRGCKSVDRTPIVRFNENVNYTHLNYWFGATIVGTNSSFVACAPLSIDRDQTSFKEFTKRVGTYGRCIRYEKPEQGTMLPTIKGTKRKENFELFEQTMDSFGWSLFMESEDSILIGGPAMISGRVIQLKPNSIKTYLNGSNINTSFNFGYAVASGRFLSKKQISIAVGSTYGTNGEGKVTFLYEHQRKLKYKELVGPAVGSMFGAVLCPASLRAAAGLTDLLVGAPAFATNDEYNVGAVYAYTGGSLNLKRTILGQMSDSYFGSAIISLGDLDGDNIDEMAIAAPYENGGTGAVYLYSGANIMRQSDPKYSQRIAPEPTMKSFGHSLAILRDYDDNGCNELAIGAPASNKVTVIRCVAAITIELSNFKSQVAGTINGVDREEKLPVCITVKFPDKPKEVKADISVDVKFKHEGVNKGSVIIFKIRHTSEKRRETYCQDTILKLSGKKGDYNKKIAYELTASLLNDPLQRTDFKPSEVVLNKHSDVSGYIWAQECGNKKCEPKLNMTATFSEESPYTVGSSKSIKADILVENTGDVAYGSCLRVNVTGAKVSPPDVCQQETDGDVETLLCKPKQLLRQTKLWLTTIEMNTTHLTNEYKSIKVLVELYNECDKKAADIMIPEMFTLLADASSMDVHGRTDEGLSNILNLTRIDIAAQKTFEHIYTISNTGPSNWRNVNISVSMQREDYFAIRSVTVENRHCESENSTNPHIGKYSCMALELNKDSGIELKVRMQVVREELGDRIGKEDLYVHSNIIVDLEKTLKTANVTTELRLSEGTVPIWIIIAACILALIILLIIFFILRECGFLKRKNKENLIRARMSVRRQTMMRRSMVNRPHSQDTEKLVKEANASQAKKKKDRRVVVNDF